ncbi:MAG: hypothetical protein N2484_03970 [Clostridia bacterium]|nr:hypothetical protein [Clostridia bacterium]
MSQKLIVVDDNPHNVTLLTQILEDAGYSVFSAEDGLYDAKKKGRNRVAVYCQNRN